MYTIFSNNSFCQFRVLVFTEEKSKFMLQDYARRHIPDHQMCSDVVKYSTRHVTTHMNASRPMHMGGNWTALQRGNSYAGHDVDGGGSVDDDVDDNDRDCGCTVVVVVGAVMIMIMMMTMMFFF